MTCRPGSQIGGRDLQRELPLKPRRSLGQQGGHAEQQRNPRACGHRPGWVALRTAAPTMMLLTYVPEGDLVRVMYVSGRREYVPIEVAWRDLDARPRLQNGRTLPNPKSPLYALYRRPKRRGEQEEYLLSIDAAHWESLGKVRQALLDGACVSCQAFR